MFYFLLYFFWKITSPGNLTSGSVGLLLVGNRLRDWKTASQIIEHLDSSLIDFFWHTKPYFKFSWKMWQDREHDEGIISPLKKVPCVTYFFYIISNFQLRQCHGNNYFVIIYLHYPVTWQKLLWHHNVFLQTKNHLISTSEIPIDSLFQRNYYFCLMLIFLQCYCVGFLMAPMCDSKI